MFSILTKKFSADLTKYVKSAPLINMQMYTVNPPPPPVTKKYPSGDIYWKTNYL